jgi:hypothetical protein
LGKRVFISFPVQARRLFPSSRSRRSMITVTGVRLSGDPPAGDDER